jgi:hypothetical protein
MAEPIKLEDRYTLIDNPAGEEGQVWFDYNETLAYPRRRVWTIVEGESGRMWAQTGYHIVNVVYYAVTEEEWTDEDIAIDYLWLEEEEDDPIDVEIGYSALLGDEKEKEDD